MEPSPSLPPNTGTDEPGASTDGRAPVAADQVPPSPERPGDAPPPVPRSRPDCPRRMRPRRSARRSTRRVGPIPWTGVRDSRRCGSACRCSSCGPAPATATSRTSKRRAALSGRAPTGERELKQLATRLARPRAQLAARLKATAPRGVYIVIDQTQNRLYLKKDDETLLEARVLGRVGDGAEGGGRQEARVGVRHAARRASRCCRCCAEPGVGQARLGVRRRRAADPEEPGRPPRVRARSASTRSTSATAT